MSYTPSYYSYSDNSSFNANVRASYQATGKITATASAGVEFRQFEGGSDDRVSPGFQLGLNYQPFDGTPAARSMALPALALAANGFTQRRRFRQR